MVNSLQNSFQVSLCNSEGSKTCQVHRGQWVQILSVSFRRVFRMRFDTHSSQNFGNHKQCVLREHRSSKSLTIPFRRHFTRSLGSNTGKSVWAWKLRGWGETQQGSRGLWVWTIRDSFWCRLTSRLWQTRFRWCCQNGSKSLRRLARIAKDPEFITSKEPLVHSVLPLFNLDSYHLNVMF